MRRMGIWALCVCLLAGMLSYGMTASAADVMLQYAGAGDGTAQITGYTGDPVAIGIPEKAGDLTVTGIADAAFEGCQTLTRIVIPDTVERIGIRAFADCELLQDITLPKGVRHIGADAFVGTAYYNDLEHWTNEALYLDNVLLTVQETAGEHVAIQDGTATVAQRAFLHVPAVQAVVIPASVSHIADDAFDGCSDVKLYMFMEATYAIEFAKSHGYSYGIIADLIEDGHIDMLDALILYNMTSKGELPSDMYYTADYDCNGIVNMMDCLHLYYAIS